MGGLLYKDFVAVRGKKLVVSFAVATVVFNVLRMLFSKMAGAWSFEVKSIVDTTFSLSGEPLILYLGFSIINNMEPKIMEFDEKKCVRSYLFSMPVSRKEYVASKYIFIGIAVYIALSLYVIWHTVSIAFMPEEGFAADCSQIVAGFAVPFTCLFLFVAATEMPLYFMFGKAKAMMLRVAFWMGIGFVAIWFLFFGDLALLENWDTAKLVNWIDVHAFGLTLLNIVSPVISLGLYYLSYRITVRLYEGRQAL